MILFVCSGDVFTIKGHGRLATGRVVKIERNPTTKCTLIRGPKFTAWGLETFCIGGPGNISGVGIPDDLEIKTNDIIAIETGDD